MQRELPWKSQQAFLVRSRPGKMVLLGPCPHQASQGEGTAPQQRTFLGSPCGWLRVDIGAP